MQKTTLYILFLIMVKAYSQNSKDNCQISYFKNSKKISTKICLDESKYKGKAFAYDIKGNIIGEWSVSRMHQLSSVFFSYHPNGAVSKAEYSSHPDAGIQWYRSFTYYDDQGNKTGFSEDSHDRQTILIEPYKKEVPVQIIPETNPPVPKQEVVQEAPIYISEFWIDNRSRKDVYVVCFYQNQKPGRGVDTLQLLPKGERIKLGEHIMAGIFENPLPYFQIRFYDLKKKKNNKVRIGKSFLTEENSKDKTRKRYYFDLLKK